MEKKRVYYFKNLLTFLNNKDSLPKLSFSLIEETGLFYVNGQFFSENTLFNLNQLLENVSGELSEKDTTNEAVIKLYKLILETNLDTNNLIKLLVSEIYDLRETTNERIDETDKIVASGLSLHGSDIDKLKATTEELKTTTDSLTNTVEDHSTNTANPHKVTKDLVGLGNVDNTSDLSKPISTATQSALDKKVDKVTGYSLSKNDFTDILKNKLDGIAEGAQVNSITGVKGSSEETYRIGNVSISASNIGLGNVNNTSDADKPISIATQTALNGKVSTTVKINGHALNADVIVSKSDVGLGNVDNTSDANKPVSTAQQTALDKKVDKTTTVNGHALSGNVTVTKTDIGLGNVDNTSDLSKPISTATQGALDGKVDKIAGKGLSTEDFTGAYKTVLDNLSTNYAPLVDGLVPAANLPSYVDDVIEAESKNKFPTTGESGKIYVALDTNLTYRWGGTKYVEISKSLALGETASTAYAGDKGAANATAISTHTGNTNNPHGVTKSQVGLGNVDNTSDLNKPVSTATQTELNKKVDKIEGKGLSTEDYTTADKTKLAGIASGAQVNSITGVKGGAEESYRTGNVNITATNLGLGNVNNTSDADKPISTATQTALNNKVDKVAGKGLSSEDYTSAEKTKLSGIESGAQVNTITGIKGSSESSYRTGNVSISPANIGLGNVDNTSDLSKPISTAVQTALDGKLSTSITTMPNPNPIKVQVKEVDLIEYDGSAVKTINLTCSDNITITSSGSTIAIGGGTYSEATNTRNGLMSSTDKAKLDSLPELDKIVTEIELVTLTI